MIVYQVNYKMKEGYETFSGKLFRDLPGAEEFRRNVMKNVSGLDLLGISQINIVARYVE